ncbi:hypothetical protein BDZ97DRAFT_1796929 [Flammula alnicola]|nr:hypothetical protein BDZ97DRAFT_1796929 [Flammula alnicola]
MYSSTKRVHDLSRLSFCKAPSLHTLKWTIVDVNDLLLMLPPWSQLRSIELRGGYAISTIFPALSQCNVLEKLTICYSIFQEPEPSSYIPVTLPNIHEVVLDCVKNQGCYSEDSLFPSYVFCQSRTPCTTAMTIGTYLLRCFPDLHVRR